MVGDTNTKAAQVGDSSDVSSILRELERKGNLKFRFGALLHRSVTELHDYGDGVPIKMLDAHILKDIDENPGILSAELAQSWCRTRSAICIIVRHLETAGYVTKRTINGNKKERALFVSEKGHRLCELHRRYDAVRTSALIDEMLDYCTVEEIDAYFKVLEYQIKVMQESCVIGEDNTVSYKYTEDNR